MKICKSMQIYFLGRRLRSVSRGVHALCDQETLHAQMSVNVGYEVSLDKKKREKSVKDINDVSFEVF